MKLAIAIATALLVAVLASPFVKAQDGSCITQCYGNTCYTNCS